VPVSNRTPVYPGDPAPQIRAAKAIRSGDAANLTELHFGAHTATHVDAPAHFIEDAGTVDKLSLDVLIGETRVIEIPSDANAITAAHVGANALQGASRVLFKTRNSGFWQSDPHSFREDFTYIAQDAAHALVEAGTRLVGIDYLSVEAMDTTHFPTHRVLLSNNVIIIEGLDLSGVTAGRYELICLPLLLAEATGDGAPARVVLRTIDGGAR
jgi:arylformamidase